MSNHTAEQAYAIALSIGTASIMIPAMMILIWIANSRKGR